MNETPSLPPEDLDEQAALWAARLEGSVLTAGERAELEKWLAGDPARRPALGAYCGFSSSLDRAVSELVESGAIEIRGPAPARSRTWWGVAGAGAAFAAVALCVLLLVRPGGRAETLTAPAGQRQAFTLSDGTRIELNANTSVVVEVGRSGRRVRMASGEAFFVVAKDKSRPFVVDTPAGSVRVTGTIFNVLTEASSQLDVTVVEGSVQVRPGGADHAEAQGTVDLGAGDRLSAVRGGVSLTRLADSDLDDALAWRQGKIVCKMMPLSEALALFAHYHGRTIVVSPGASALHVGGRYSIEDLDGFLAQLELVQQDHKVRVDRGPGGAIRVSLAAEP